MKNSRKDGLLILHCKKPYQMSDDTGKMIEQHRVICKDINFEAEHIAYDLEHYMKLALFNMPVREEHKKLAKEIDRDEDRADKFYNNECPSMKEVEEHANNIEMIIGMNKEIQLSKIMETFEGLIRCKLIMMEGNIPMPFQTWKTLHRADKARIMYNYIAFFVNPLQRLQKLSTETEESHMQGEMQKTLMR